MMLHDVRAYLLGASFGLACYFLIPWYAQVAPSILKDTVLTVEGYRWLYRLSLLTLIAVYAFATPKLRLLALLAVCFWISFQASRFDSQFCEVVSTVFDLRIGEHSCSAPKYISV